MIKITDIFKGKKGVCNGMKVRNKSFMGYVFIMMHLFMYLFYLGLNK